MSIQKRPLVNDLYTADPSAHVFNGKIYIYPSHDEDADVENNDNGDQYDMKDYHVYEMKDTETYPRDCGCAFTLKDVKWASKQLWAPDCVEKMENITSFSLLAIKKVSSVLVLQLATNQKDLLSQKMITLKAHIQLTLVCSQIQMVNTILLLVVFGVVSLINTEITNGLPIIRNHRARNLLVLLKLL